MLQTVAFRRIGSMVLITAPLLLGTAPCQPASGVDPDLNSDGVLDATDMFIFITGWHRPVDTATPSATPEPTATPIAPFVAITDVSPYGDADGSVCGLARNLGSTDDWRVAVYIHVAGGWYNKPTFAEPLCPVRPNGTWCCDITTGGNDGYADLVAAFLVPAGVAPPVCNGCPVLPDFPEAADRVVEERLQGVRTIPFAGHVWVVKTAPFPLGPGPNRFSDDADDVRVDDQGNLHLSIAERDGTWYSTEVVNTQSFGYGRYVATTRGRIDRLNENVVLGMFTWDGSAFEEAFRELDFEYARWGDAENPTNAQYAVQPCSACPGCGDRCTRFQVELTDESSDLTHVLDWAPGRAEFATYLGAHPDGQASEDARIAGWVFADSSVPAAGGEEFRLNLWLVNGQAPSDGLETEVTVTGFAFIPR